MIPRGSLAPAQVRLTPRTKTAELSPRRPNLRPCSASLPSEADSYARCADCRQNEAAGEGSDHRVVEQLQLHGRRPFLIVVMRSAGRPASSRLALDHRWRSNLGRDVPARTLHCNTIAKTVP